MDIGGTGSSTSSAVQADAVQICGKFWDTQYEI